MVQGKASAVATTFIQIRSGSEFISPARQRVPGQNAIGTSVNYFNDFEIFAKVFLETIAHFRVCSAGDSTQGMGSSLYGADKQPSISIRGRNSSPMESERQASVIGKTRRGDDQSAEADGIASSLGWDMDTGNMLNILVFFARKHASDSLSN